MVNASTTASPLQELIVSTFENEPYTIMNKDLSFGGYLKELLDQVSIRAGFTYKFVRATEATFGTYTAGKGWSGVLGDVDRGIADIGGAAFTPTPRRSEDFEFTFPLMSQSVNLLVNKPEWTDLGLGYLVRPFSSDFWIMLLVVLLLIGIVFFIIGKFSPYEWGNVAADRDPRGAKNSFTLRNSYLFALSTLTWQGFREAPKSLSGRIMAAFWWMFVLFSLIAYTANLTAYFMARPEQMPKMAFSSYEELAESTDITIGALKGGSTQAALRSSEDKSLKAIWAKINAHNSWEDSYKSGAHRVATSDGNFVMFMEENSAELEARRNCDLMMYGKSLFPSSLSLVLPKRSLWKQRIDSALRDLKANDFLSQLKEKYFKYSGDCSNVDGRKFSTQGNTMSTIPIYPVTLKDMSVAILLLFLGFIAAMVFLVAEIIHYAVTKKGKKIEKPKIPKIFKPKSKGSKEGPTGDVEEGAEAGPSDGLESVPLDDEPVASGSDEARAAEEGEKPAV